MLRIYDLSKPEAGESALRTGYCWLSVVLIFLVCELNMNSGLHCETQDTLKLVLQRMCQTVFCILNQIVLVFEVK